MMKLVTLILAAFSLLAGCGALQDASFSSSANSSRPVCLSDEDGKKWDLGTGYALDIRRTAPGFLSLRPEGWSMPEQPFLAEQAVREQPRLALKNRRRLDAIAVADLEIERETTQVDDIQAFDLVAKPITPYRIRRFTVLDQVAILVTPGTCPHLFAADSCEDGRLTTTITNSGTVNCVGPFSMPDHLMIAFSERGEKTKLELGTPLLVESKNATIFMFSPEGKPMGKAERELNDYDDALPEEVLATFVLPTEQPAALLFKNIPSQLLTTGVKERITKERLEAVTKAASKVNNPEGAIQLARTRLPNGTLPGDDEVAAIVRMKIADGAKTLGDPGPQNFKMAMLLVRALRAFKGTDADVNAIGVEDRYGPLLANGTIRDDKDRTAFLEAFPGSPHSEKLKVLMSQEIEQANAEEQARWAEAEINGAFAGLAETADRIITTRWQAAFVVKHLEMMRNQRRSLAGANAFKAEADRMQREDFCPARRDFVKKYGTKELQSRAKEKCDTEPPTTTGEMGRQVVLEKECRALFASGC